MHLSKRTEIHFGSHIFSWLIGELEPVYINVTYVIHKQACFILDPMALEKLHNILCVFFPLNCKYRKVQFDSDSESWVEKWAELLAAHLRILKLFWQGVRDIVHFISLF